MKKLNCISRFFKGLWYGFMSIFLGLIIALALVLAFGILFGAVDLAFNTTILHYLANAQWPIRVLAIINLIVTVIGFLMGFFEDDLSNF